MYNSKKRSQGFTIKELVISLGVVCILGALAWPAYQNFLRRTYYGDILAAITPYKAAVTACFQDTHTLTDCNGGLHHIPANILVKKGPIASLKVYAGIIVATPVPEQGVLATDVYILTPTAQNGTLTWVSSGGAVQKAYAE